MLFLDCFRPNARQKSLLYLSSKVFSFDWSVLMASLMLVFDLFWNCYWPFCKFGLSARRACSYCCFRSRSCRFCSYFEDFVRCLSILVARISAWRRCSSALITLLTISSSFSSMFLMVSSQLCMFPSRHLTICLIRQWHVQQVLHTLKTFWRPNFFST